MVSGLEGSPTYTRIQVLQTTSTWPARWTPDTLQLTDEQSNELTGATTNQPSDSCPSPVTVYSDTLHRSGRLSRSTTEDREDTPTPHTARYRPTNLWNALKTGARRNTGDLHQSIANQMWLLLPLHTRCYQTSQRNKQHIKQMQYINKSHDLQTHNALCTQSRQSGWDYNLRTE